MTVRPGTNPVDQMALSDKQSRQLIDLGATFDERLSLACTDTEPPTLAPPLQTALRFWQRTYQKQHGQADKQRLAWDGLTQSILQQRISQSISTDSFDTGDEAITWVDGLGELIAGLKAIDLDPSADLDIDQPFAELFRPLANRLLASLPLPEAVAFEPSATMDLRNQLLRGLASLAAPSLYPAFLAGKDQTGYRDFIQTMANGGLVAHLLRYPVLARRLLWLVQSWRDNSTRLLGHLHGDWPQLVEQFGIDPKARLCHIASRLSERHDGGRQVCSLLFSDGTRLIHKPRSVALEAAWHNLLNWLQQRGCCCTPPALKMVAGQQHGWFEFVEQASESNAQTIHAFARRAGGLVCLAWLLNARDLHSENVIATSRGPCLIDAETLLQPTMPPTARDSGAMQMARAQVDNSCLASGLLHFPVEYAQGKVVDHSGLLGALSEQTPMREDQRWTGLGSDALKLEQTQANAVTTGHRLIDDKGRPVDLAQHLDGMVDGFRQMWAFLAQHRDGLCAANGPLSAFRGVATRVVLRPSNLYAQIQQQLLSEPKLQTHGALPGLMIDTLNRYLPSSDEPPSLWPLVAEERHQLERLDIPVARTHTDSRALSLGRRTIEDYYPISGWQLMRQRLELLASEQAMQAQLQLLQSASSHSDHRHCCRPPRHKADDIEVDDASMLAMAMGIGDQLLSQAVSGKDGALAWLAPSYLRTQDHSDRGASHYLYDGAMGIAVFLAALARQTRQQRYGDAALRAIRPLQQLFASSNPGALLQHEGIGACNGLGSLVIGALHLEQLSGEPAMLDLACQVAGWIDQQRIDNDHRLDIEGGAAGALMAILSLQQRRADARWLQLAGQLGQHLLDHAQPADPGVGWPNQAGLLQTGLAHGAGGIAAALAMLHSHQPQTWLKQTVEQALAYERSLFNHQQGNWPVLLHDADNNVQRRYMLAWCNGAPGIAISRMLIGQAIPELESRDELAWALRATRTAGIGAVDHFCCGTAGLADVLLETGRWQHNQADLALARQLLADIAHRHLQLRQPLVLHPDPQHNQCFRPGLFRGVAGVGYATLRLLDPELASLCIPGRFCSRMERAA